MQKVIELTQQVEEAVIEYGQAVGIVAKEAAKNILMALRKELEHEIRVAQR